MGLYASLNLRADGASGNPQVIFGLESEPHLGRNAKRTRQAQGGIGRDTPFAVDDLANPSGRHHDLPCQTIDADPHGMEKLLSNGRTTRCVGGYEAFVPAPLPPPIEWDAGLAAALSRADLALGRLAGEGRRLPNPHLFIRSFIRREAVLSSRIEGTRTTLEQLLAAEAGAAAESAPADLLEVGNHASALEYGLDRLETLPLSLRLIREI